ncbi:MAG: translocation/assembly module TamB, partial [Bacteroidota bacterium]|nr:translocation/assembly module TamB [Bacteroidota bacterium]
MNAKLKELSSNYKDLKRILPRILGQKLPSTLDFLGIFSTKGIISMSDQKININCDISTELGEIYADLNLNDIKEIDAASYNGKLKLTEFDLGTFIQNSDVGRVNTNLIIEGEGFKTENIRSNIAGTFDGFEYNNYNYKDLEVLGLVENKIFSGQLKANDKHLMLDFEGLVDFSEKENIYDFSAYVKKADLNALNFVKRDSLSVFSGRVDMDMRGTNIDDLYGLLQFKDTRYTNQNDSYFFKDFQVVSTFDSDLNHTLSVNSPEIIEGTFEGFFKIKQVPLMLENALNGIYSQVVASEISADQSLKFNFKVYNKIIEVFYPDLEFGANTFFRGVLDSDPSKFKLTFKSPDIRMESYFAKKVEIKFDNSNPLFNSYVELDSLSTPYMKANEFSLINVSLNDTLYIKSQFKGGKRREDQFDLNLYYTTDDKNYVLGLKPSKAKFK